MQFNFKQKFLLLFETIITNCWFIWKKETELSHVLLYDAIITKKTYFYSNKCLYTVTLWNYKPIHTDTHIYIHLKDFLTMKTSLNLASVLNFFSKISVE